MAAQIISKDDWDCLSIRKLAAAFNVSRDTVANRLRNCNIAQAGIRDGHPVYKLGDAARAILITHVDPFNGETDPDKMSPKDRRDWLAGDNEKDERDERRRKLVSVEEVRVEWGAILQLIGATLDVIADKLERKVGLSPEAQDLVDMVIDSARNDLADALEQDVLPKVTEDLFAD